MTRGLLPDDVLNEIDARLPDVLSVTRGVRHSSPDLFAYHLGPSDDRPLALICIGDWTDTMAAVRIALFEYFAHGVYYREHAEPPGREREALFFERFFLECAAFRLVVASDHLTRAILFMKRISDSDLGKRRKGAAARLADFLVRTQPSSELTAAVMELGQSVSWRATVEYRDRLTHDQSPLIRGLGLQYRRRSRWKTSTDGTKHFLALVAGDAPEYEIGDIATNVLAANQAMVKLGDAVVREYDDILRSAGIHRTTNGWLVGG